MDWNFFLWTRYLGTGHDRWPAADDARACYGFLLSRHYGYQEARLAFGGYDWGGGMAQLPALDILIDNATSTVSRLSNGTLNPAPNVVLINLGENGAPAYDAVTKALKMIRKSVKKATKIIVMIPVSGRARSEVTGAFYLYKKDSGDDQTFLIDLGPVKYATCDGQHPTAAGHDAIFEAALPDFDLILTGSNRETNLQKSSRQF